MAKNNNTRNLLIGVALLFFLMRGSTKGSGGVKSKYYTPSIIQASTTAAANNITEQFEPLDAKTIESVNYFIRNLIDPLTALMGGDPSTFDIESWYRHKKLNAHPSIGGSDTSDHLDAQAIDFDFIDNGIVANQKLIKKLLLSKLPFSQLILYGSQTKPSQLHLALSSDSGNKREILRKTSSGYVSIDELDLLNSYSSVVV